MTAGVRGAGVYATRRKEVDVACLSLTKETVVISKIEFAFPICVGSERSTVMSIKDFLLGQRRSSKADSQTNPPPSNQSLHVGHAHGLSRRGFIQTAAGATALAFGPGLSLKALAHDDGDNHGGTLPAPKPIPGGLEIGL